MKHARERLAWTALLLLAAVTAAQGFLPVAQRRVAADPFDAFFDDEPFARLSRLHGLTLSGLEADGLRARAEETDDSVVVAIEVPRRKDASVKVSLDGRLIRASCEIVEARSRRRVERLLTAPPAADPSSARIERSEGEIRVVFAKRPVGPRA